jgi:cation transporter-like permease
MLGFGEFKTIKCRGKFKEKIIMSLLTLLLTLCVIGVILYLVNNFVPMDGKIKTIINIIVIVAVIIYVLNAFGALTFFTTHKNLG